MLTEIKRPLNDPETFSTEYYKLQEDESLITLLIGFLLGSATAVFGVLLYIYIFI